MPLGTDPSPTARTLTVDDEVMEKFDRVLESLPKHMQIILDLSQGKGELSPAQGEKQGSILPPYWPPPFSPGPPGGRG